MKYLYVNYILYNKKLGYRNRGRTKLSFSLGNK